MKANPRPLRYVSTDEETRLVEVHAKVREGAWGEIGARYGTDVVGRMQGEIASSVTSGNGDGGKILTVARGQ